MAGFLYFVEGFKNVPTPLDLAGLQLGHLGPVASGVPCESGPNGMRGMTLAVPQSELGPDGAEPKVGYYKDSQVWRQWGEYWIGYESQSPPGPGDLVRRELPGEGRGWPVKMGDGQEYVVPSVTFLPDRLSINPDGTLRREVKDQFKDLADLTERLRNEYLWKNRPEGEEAGGDAGGTGQSELEPLTELEQLRLGGGFLGLYYRIGDAEAEMLELWDDDSMREALRAILDIPGYLAMMDKKKEDAAGTGSEGL